MPKRKATTLNRGRWRSMCLDSTDAPPSAYTDHSSTALPKSLVSTTDFSTGPYRKLAEKEIRVLILLPGGFNDPLYALLEHIKLPDRPALQDELKEDYEAISYAWGPSSKPRQIGIVGGGFVPITDSLYWALKYFRRENTSRRLWADAICIKQDDTSERNMQVSFMADVYDCARSVLVWLGVGDESDALAFATLQVVEKLCRPDDSNFPSLKDIQDILDMTYTQAVPSHFEMPSASTVLSGLSAVIQLTQRAWFTRLWTVQEVHGVPKAVKMCSGHFSCRKVAFASALIIAIQNWSSLKRIMSLSRGLRQLVNDISEGFGRELTRFDSTIASTISEYYNKSCSNPLDRVYAVRKVFCLQGLRALVPDYDKTPAKLYRDFVWSVLTAKMGYIHNALILAYVGTERDFGRPGLRPTWVADINHLSAASRRKSGLYNRSFLASPRPFWVDQADSVGQYFLPESCPKHPDRLRLRGRCFASCLEPLPVRSIPEVSTVHTRLDPQSTLDIEIFLNWYSACRRLVAPIVDTTDDVEIATMRFLNYPTLYTASFGNRLQDWKESIQLEHSQGLVNRFASQILDLSDQFRHWMHWAMSVMLDCPLTRERRLWKVVSDRRTDIAWLPKQTQVGDQVCLFAGTPWPFVLRDAEDGAYNLIGDGHTFATPLIEALGGNFVDIDSRASFQLGEPLGLNMPGQLIGHLIEKLDWITLS